MEEEFKPIDANINSGDEPNVDFIKTDSVVIKSDNNDLAEEEGQLAVDVYQTPEEIIIDAPVAGVKPENLDIDITSESVTIKGKREKEMSIKEEDFFYQECYWGKFSRSIILPQEIDAEKAEASLKNGVLTIRLPKLNRRHSKKIKVRSD